MKKEENAALKKNSVQNALQRFFANDVTALNTSPLKSTWPTKT